jgi:hypothetical protein
MTVHDSSSLSALMRAYENCIVFEESAPGPLPVAKIFTRMRASNGGLVLLGVRDNGTIVGLKPEEVEAVYARFGILCADLTQTRIEIGTLVVRGYSVVFMVFNTTRRNLAPVRHYSRFVMDTRFV